MHETDLKCDISPTDFGISRTPVTVHASVLSGMHRATIGLLLPRTELPSVILRRTDRPHFSYQRVFCCSPS